MIQVPNLDYLEGTEYFMPICHAKNWRVSIARANDIRT